MNKILLDFGPIQTEEQVQEYLMLKLDFPSYYGKNLDALFDGLTDLSEDTCIGVMESSECPVQGYLKKVKKVLWEAEQENNCLCIFFAQKEENYGIFEGQGP